MGISWWAFLVVVVLAYVVPGPDFAVILRAATRRWRAGFAAALGAQTGLCVHMLIAVAGLSVLLARNPEALTAVRLAGAAYLVVLGLRLIRSTFGPARVAQDATGQDVPGVRQSFVQGFWTNLLNPKAILFFASVLPQFVVTGPAVQLQVLALGLVDVVVGVAVWSVLVAVGAQLRRTMARPVVRRWWDRATGGALTALGGTLATAKL